MLITGNGVENQRKYHLDKSGTKREGREIYRGKYFLALTAVVRLLRGIEST